jgi:hypothetical protein
MARLGMFRITKLANLNKTAYSKFVRDKKAERQTIKEFRAESRKFTNMFTFATWFVVGSIGMLTAENIYTLVKTLSNECTEKIE